eukprot:6206775-Pleurochrysis_carterae.AAC.1
MLIAPKKRRREEPTPKVCASSADPKPAASSASQEPIDVADTPGKRVQIESASLGEADGADALNEEDEKQQQEREEREDDELLDRVERRRQENSRMREPPPHNKVFTAVLRCSQLYADFSKVATEEQIARFEQYKRSKFPRAAMKKLMTDVVGTSTERCAIVLVRFAPVELIAALSAHTFSSRAPTFLFGASEIRLSHNVDCWRLSQRCLSARSWRRPLRRCPRPASPGLCSRTICVPLTGKRGARGPCPVARPTVPSCSGTATAGLENRGWRHQAARRLPASSLGRLHGARALPQFAGGLIGPTVYPDQGCSRTSSVFRHRHRFIGGLVFYVSIGVNVDDWFCPEEERLWLCMNCRVWQ